MCLIYAITALKGKRLSIYEGARKITERRRIYLADEFTRYYGKKDCGTSGFPAGDAFEPLVSCDRGTYTGVQHHSKVVFHHSREVVGLKANVESSSLNVVKVRREKKLPVGEALAGLLPFFALATMVLIWLSLRPVILREHLLPFMFFLGACFAYQVGLIIVSHLIMGPFPFVNILLLPIFVGMADAVGPFLHGYTGGIIGWPSALGDGPYEVAYVFLCMGLALGVYGSFVVSILVAGVLPKAVANFKDAD